HHERYDGNGYPRGLVGEEIPIMARILCVADSFDAMISKRSYKKPCQINFALNVLNEESYKQFDPKIASQLIRLVNDGIIKTITEDNRPVQNERN
ncbi:MAG: HD domain-containing phosphohydrolase, partial [Anaerovorax sp.]